MSDDSHSAPDRSLAWALAALVWPIVGTLVGGAVAQALRAESHSGQTMIFGGLIGLALGSIACALQISMMRKPKQG